MLIFLNKYLDTSTGNLEDFINTTISTGREITTSAEFLGVWSWWSSWTYTTEDFCYGTGVTGRYRTRNCTTEPTKTCTGDSREEFTLGYYYFFEPFNDSSLYEITQKCREIGSNPFTGLKLFCTRVIITGETAFWTGLRTSFDLYNQVTGSILLYQDDGTDDMYDSTYFEVTNKSYFQPSFKENLQLGKTCLFVNERGILHLANCNDTLPQTSAFCDLYKNTAKNDSYFGLNQV